MSSLVFVYGTLKRDFINYDYYLKPAAALGKASFLAAAATAKPNFCLVLSRTLNIPCLYRPQHPSDQGYSVQGELFRVDKDVLRALDVFEGIDSGSYYREEIEVSLAEDSADGQLTAGETVTAFIYLKVYREKFVGLQKVPSYSPELHATSRLYDGTPTLRILSHIYGEAVTDQEARRRAGLRRRVEGRRGLEREELALFFK